MKLFPAIDLRNGKAVRLFKGDYDKMDVYGDPVATACSFETKGAKYLHLVDLDGAKSGSPENFEVIGNIVGDTKMFVEVGGGIRDEKQILDYFNLGVKRVILGTIAITDFDFLRTMVSKYGERIAVGVDVLDRRVAIHGWTTVTSTLLSDFVAKLTDIGVSHIIVTDIDKDGTLQGTNLELYRELVGKGVSVTASGGISDVAELEKLTKLGVSSAILGKALYTGTIDLSEALRIAGGQ